MDDVLNLPNAQGSKVIYFSASFCVPGFFLLSGYLFGLRDTLSFEYIENKVTTLMLKLFGWVVFWCVILSVKTGQMQDIWGNFTASMCQGGILPVAWFLFTYCLICIISYPIWYVFRRKEIIVVGISGVWMILLALQFGKFIPESVKLSYFFYRNCLE